MKRLIRTVRQVLDLALILLVVAVLGIVLAANVGPGLGHQLVVIRGGSMAPAIPLGSLVDVVRVRPEELKVGDVVTRKAPNGVVVTHRVNRVVRLPDGALYLETKGDANAKPDVPLEPAASITGRVAFEAPFLGYLMFMLTIPSGIASIFCLAITLLLAVWLLEDLEEEEAEEAAGSEPAPSPEDAAETFPSWADEPRVEQERRGARLRRTMAAPVRSLSRARRRAQEASPTQPSDTAEAAE